MDNNDDIIKYSENENIKLNDNNELDDDIIEDAVFYGYEGNCDFENLDE